MLHGRGRRPVHAVRLWRRPALIIEPSRYAGMVVEPSPHRTLAQTRTFTPAASMRNMTTIEAKAFVPARDFDLAKRFYQDLGFDLAWSSEDLAYFRHGNSSFLLQNCSDEANAYNFMMHLLV